MLLQVIEAMMWKNQSAAGHTQSQKTIHAKKDGMLQGKIISSYLLSKSVNNCSPVWEIVEFNNVA